MNNQATPATTSLAYNYMSPKWQRINAVLGGLDTMRDAGSRLLPAHERESSDNYNERLNRARLVNWSEITLDSLVGRPFSDPLKLSDEAQTRIGEYEHNINLMGDDLNTFAREVFKTGVAKSFCHVLVEFPRVDKNVPRTLDDDRKENLRPYMVRIAPESVIFAETTIKQGREVLTHVRIAERHVQRSGWEETVTDRIRVLEPGQVTVYELQEVKGQIEKQWVVVESFQYDLDFIPLVTFYADRSGCMTGKPPLLDLVDLNIAHWQSSSDQVQVLTVSRFPILAASGVAAEDSIDVGPKNMIKTSEPQSRVYYVEHTGRAIAAGQTDLDTLEKQMAGYGAQFLLRRPGRETATARALDSAESTTPLADMTVRFIHAMEQALSYLLAWEGDTTTSTAGWIILPVEFGPDVIEAADLQTLDNARARGDISQVTYWKELRRRGLLADDFDPAKERQQLEDEDPADMVGTQEDVE